PLVIYPVEIFFPQCIMPGMEICRNRFSLYTTDILWQKPVQCCGNPLHRNGYIYEKVGYLTQGMYTGIGPAGTLQLYRFFIYYSQGFFQFLLYGFTGILLSLPATIVSTIIFYCYLDVSHPVTSIDLDLKA